MKCRPGCYDRDLDKNAANYVPLTPLSFLERAAAVYPGQDGGHPWRARYSYREFDERCHRLASALAKAGVGHRRHGRGAVAAIFPATLEAHYGVPMVGAVLNAMNTAWMPPPSRSALTMARPRSSSSTASWRRGRARGRGASWSGSRSLVEIERRRGVSMRRRQPQLGGIDYEEFLGGGDPAFAGGRPPTSGRRSASTTPPARPAIPRASSIIIAAPT